MLADGEQERDDGLELVPPTNRLLVGIVLDDAGLVEFGQVHVVCPGDPLVGRRPRLPGVVQGFDGDGCGFTIQTPNYRTPLLVGEQVQQRARRDSVWRSRHEPTPADSDERPAPEIMLHTLAPRSANLCC